MECHNKDFEVCFGRSKIARALHQANIEEGTSDWTLSKLSWILKTDSYRCLSMKKLQTKPNKAVKLYMIT